MALKLSELLKKSEPSFPKTGNSLKPWKSESTLTFSRDVSGTKPTTFRDVSGTKPTTFRDVSGTKPTTFRDVPGTKPTTFRDVPGTKPTTFRDVPGTKPTTFRDVPGTKPTTFRDVSGTKPTTFRDVSGTKLVKIKHKIEPVYIKKLKGIQKKIIDLFLSDCHMSQTNITSPFNILDLANSTGERVDSLKQALKRLKRKGYIKTDKFQPSHYGFSSFEISKSFLHFVPETVIVTNSNSSLNKKTITIEKKEKKISEQKDNFSNSVLPPEWEKIDTSPMENVGLTKNKLLDIFKSGNISAEGVQESINHFAWGYEHNSKNYQYKNLLAVFIGALRKGSLWSETGYESPKALALKKVLELKKKQQAEEDQLIDELVSTEFPEWESKLTDAEKEKIYTKQPWDIC